MLLVARILLLLFLLGLVARRLLLFLLGLVASRLLLFLLGLVAWRLLWLECLCTTFVFNEVSGELSCVSLINCCFLYYCIVEGSKTQAFCCCCFNCCEYDK